MYQLTKGIAYNSLDHNMFLLGLTQLKNTSLKMLQVLHLMTAIK